MSAVSVLKSFGGVARRFELTAAGVSGSALERAVVSGEVHRPAHGVYALAAADPALLTIKMAKAAPACVTEAQRLGLWVLRRPAVPHASVNHGKPLPGFIVHRASGPIDITLICIQCLRCLPELEALCIVESAVIQKLVTFAELRNRLGRQRDSPALRVLSLVDPHSQSIIETVARYHLKSAGYSVQTQVYIRGVGRLDLFIDGLLGLEVDGRKFHSGPVDFAEDRRRWNLLTAGGVRILRITYSMLVEAPEEFLALVKRTLAGGTAH